jgi:hypothetical protein
MMMLAIMASAPIPVHAQAIQKWMTSSGTLYLGDNPPPGSVLLGSVGDVEPAARSAVGGVPPNSDSADSSAGIFAVAFLVFLCATGLWFVFVQTSELSAPAWPFHFQRPLPHPHQELYFRLRKALPDHMVLTQIRFSRFLSVKSGHWFYLWMVWICRLSADFLVCAKDSSVLVAIELIAGDRDPKGLQFGGAKKTKALSSANVRLVRWSATKLPNEDMIRREILGPRCVMTHISSDTGQGHCSRSRNVS